MAVEVPSPDPQIIAQVETMMAQMNEKMTASLAKMEAMVAFVQQTTVQQATLEQPNFDQAIEKGSPGRERSPRRLSPKPGGPGILP